jgi:hypothetical protein
MMSMVRKVRKLNVIKFRISFGSGTVASDLVFFEILLNRPHQKVFYRNVEH